MYQINGFLVLKEQDDFNNGCLPETQTSLALDLTIKAETKRGIISKLKENFPSNDFEFNACDEIGRVDIQVLEDNDGNEASNQQILDWKKGKQDLYLANYSGMLEEIKPAKF